MVSVLYPSRTIYGKRSCLKFTMSPDGKNGWFPAGWYLTWQTHSLHVKQIRVTWFWVSVYLSGESRLWLNDNESGNLDLSDFVSYFIWIAFDFYNISRFYLSNTQLYNYIWQIWGITIIFDKSGDFERWLYIREMVLRQHFTKKKM